MVWQRLGLIEMDTMLTVYCIHSSACARRIYVHSDLTEILSRAFDSASPESLSIQVFL